MIPLFISQNKLLLSKRSTNYLLLITLMYIIVLLYFTGIFTENYNLLIHKEMYFHSYMTESVSLLKFMVVLHAIYSVFHVGKLHQLDGFYLSRNSKFLVYTTRLSVVLYKNAIYSLLGYILILVIGFFLTPYMMTYKYIELGFNIVLFSFMYTAISCLIYITSRKEFYVLFIVLFYFITTIFTPFYIGENDFSLFEEIVQLFSSDLIVFEDFSMGTYYGSLYTVTKVIILLTICLRVYTKKDVPL